MPAPHETNQLIPPPQGDDDTTQLAKMIAAKPYLALDQYLDRLRNTGALKLDEIVQVADGDKRMALWRKHANIGEGVFITQRFFCEYVRCLEPGEDHIHFQGFNLHLAGENFIGANCTFVDVCPSESSVPGQINNLMQVFIGLRTMVGPDVKIYTPDHPISPEARAGLNGEEWGRPVTIEEDCWICGGAIILPGVTIGKGSTVAAGAVVTKSVPPRSLVMGNPARVVKKILEDGTTVKA